MQTRKMDEILYDDDPHLQESLAEQGSEELSIGNLEKMLEKGKTQLSAESKRDMDKSRRSTEDEIEEEYARARQAKQDEIDEDAKYEESFEEMKTASPASASSSTKRVQSAKLEGLRFTALEEKSREDRRPKSSPAGKTSQKGTDKLPAATNLPDKKAEPKKIFSPVGSPGAKDGLSESKGSPLFTPQRPNTAPDSRRGGTFTFATPGYDPTPGKTLGRQRLEQVLEDIYARKRDGKYQTGEMRIFKNVLSTGQITVHQRWKYQGDGLKVEATPPFAMELQHHNVSDYRAFRPTSANKRLMPSRDRSTEQFLLPGQKKKEELYFYDGKKLRNTMHDSMSKAMTMVEKCYNEWEEKISRANYSQQKRLHDMHKTEMDELIESFDTWTPSELMVNLKDEDKFPRHEKGKHIMVSDEHKEYVNKQLAIQKQHNENRMHVLRTHVKNRHRAEITTIRENTRAPLELLTRTRYTQEDVLVETSKKVINKIVHAEKIIKTIKNAVDPTILLRAQKAEEECMTLARIGIKSMQEVAANIESVFEEALSDYINGELAIKAAQAAQGPLDVDVNAAFSGTGKSKSDTIRPRSSTYTPQHFERRINGYKYRSRSPPRGSPQKDTETSDRLTRPKPLSARTGKLLKSRHDVLIEQAKIPYAKKQYGKGRDGMKQMEMPRLWTSTRFAREQEAKRPNTAPNPSGDSMGLAGTTPREEGEGKARLNSGSPGKSKNKHRPKTAANVRDGRDDKRQTEGKWDPSTMHIDIDKDLDDDASLGIMHDPGDDTSIVDSIGEGSFDLEKAKLEKRRNLATAHELAVMDRKAKEAKERERRKKKLTPKIRVPPNPTDELCAECDIFFGGKSKLERPHMYSSLHTNPILLLHY